MEFVDVTYHIFFSLSLVRCTSLHKQKKKIRETYRMCKTGRERNPTCDKSYHCSPICSEAVVAIATLRVVEFENLVFLVVDEVVI